MTHESITSAIPIETGKKAPTVETLCQAVAEHEAPVAFEHQGKRYVIMTEEEFEFYDEMEECWLNQRADAALAKGEKPIPWNEIRKKYGFSE